MEKVVILIIAHKSVLSEYEIASLKQCYKVLGKYPIKLICPQGLDVSVYKKINPQVEIDFIDPKWQATYAMFNRLKIEPFLYNRYKKYEYILFYELDAWVFRDELINWCNAGFDYIGAPWVERLLDGKPVFYPEGGNGGLSLRKVKSHLKVLKKWKIMKRPMEVWNEYVTFHNTFNFLIRTPLIAAKMAGYKNNSFLEVKNYMLHEDIFWCQYAKNIYPQFKLAPADIEVKFSFETNPSLLFDLNNKQLPFGCHAWRRYDPGFWESFISSGL